MLRRNSPRGDIQKTPIISMGSLALIAGSILLIAAGGVVIWDFTANDKYLISYVVDVRSKQIVENSNYAPLPVNKSKAPGPTPKNMVWVPGGSFWMGGDDQAHFYAQPIHKVYVNGFWMGKYEATNAEWREFAAATKYKTVAERPPNPKDFPHLDPNFVKKQDPFSLVFSPPPFPLRDLRDHKKWWKLSPLACWHRPFGKGSSIKKMQKHPVVHICWSDTQAFLKWKNDENQTKKKDWEYRLATEAEWEFAARGGKHMEKFIWGDKLKPKGKWLGNIWQGRFPNSNTKEDGYVLTAPVGSYPPNAFGLHDMAGNVWEWCHDFYGEDYYKTSPQKNPPGPIIGFDPLEPGLAKRVQRGGSFLCDASYCERYLTYTRGKGEVTSAANHVGFRYVLAKKISGK